MARCLRTDATGEGPPTVPENSWFQTSRRLPPSPSEIGTMLRQSWASARYRCCWVSISKRQSQATLLLMSARRACATRSVLRDVSCWKAANLSGCYTPAHVSWRNCGLPTEPD